MPIGPANGFVLAIRSLVEHTGVVGIFGGVALKHRQGKNTPGFACRGPCSCLVDMEYPHIQLTHYTSPTNNPGIVAWAVVSLAYWAIYRGRAAGVFFAVAFCIYPSYCALSLQGR